MADDCTILVTGSSGMLGTALSERLLADGYSVVGVDRTGNRWSSEVDERTRRVDLRHPAQVNSLPDDVDLVVHLAANSRVYDLVTAPRKAHENLETTFNVLEYARRANCSRFLLASSREVYPDGGGPHDVEDARIDECHNPYAASKMGAEALASAYHHCYGLRVSSLRFSNVYGRYDVSDRVVPRFIARANRGEDLVVYGEEKSLDFLYLDDCIDGVRRAIERFPEAAGVTFNIASGTGTSLVDLAEAVGEHVPHDVGVQVRPNRVGEAAESVADISDATSVLGYTPRRSPLGGLSETVAWYRSHGLLDEIR